MVWFWLMPTPIFQSWFQLVIDIKSVGLGFSDTSDIWLNLYWINRMMHKMTTFILGLTVGFVGVAKVWTAQVYSQLLLLSTGLRSQQVHFFKMITWQKRKKNTRKMMEITEATSKIYECWEFFWLSSLTLIWKKETFTFCISFKHVRLHAETDQTWIWCWQYKINMNIYIN